MVLIQTPNLWSSIRHTLLLRQLNSLPRLQLSNVSSVVSLV